MEKPETPFRSLQVFVKQEKSQSAAADRLGITPQYLSDILKKRRGISPKVAKKLGFTKVTEYRRIEAAQQGKEQ